MSDKVPEPTELIYTPADSWAAPLIAAGIAIMLAGIFSAWWWAVIGAAFLIAGLRSWWNRSTDEIAGMRREQEVGTAVIPADPIRRRG